MNNLQNLNVAQLRAAVAIKEEIEELEARLASIVNGQAVATPRAGRRVMSAVGRAAIAAAQRARWAKFRNGTAKPKAAFSKNTVKKKRFVSAATKARLAASAKARWAKAKAAGKTAL